MSGFLDDLRHAVNERIERLKKDIAVGLEDHGAYREKCGRIKEAESFLTTIQETHQKYMTHDIDDDDEQEMD